METSKFRAFGGKPSVEISPGLWFCESRNLYWKDGRVYDELSASHNGLIGLGSQFKQILKENK